MRTLAKEQYVNEVYKYLNRAALDIEIFEFMQIVFMFKYGSRKMEQFQFT